MINNLFMRWVTFAVAAATFGGVPGLASAVEAVDFWSVRPGMNVLELSGSFGGLACGTNGGPAATRIYKWSNFASCPAEAGSGLHEVQFIRDDEAEYIARALRNESTATRLAGNLISIVPVITSALIDDDGFVIGARAVTDPRIPTSDRLKAVSLSNFIMTRFGAEGWDCEDLPRGEGERPIGDLFVKEHCTKTVEGLNLDVQAYFYRKSGQVGIDTRTGQATEGEFRSEVRFEMMLAEDIPDAEERLAALSANPPAPSAGETNREKAMDCPGCDLAGLSFKGQDLSGANLAGANLAGANFHDANLGGADLSGADLSGANLNRATLVLTTLPEANLAGAMAYGAVFDGADLSGADLTKMNMAEARMIRANLSNAKVVSVDLSRSRLSNINLSGADLSGTWLIEAQMNRANLSGAKLVQSVLVNARIDDTDLTEAQFLRADLFGADLRDSNLTRTDFTGSRLQSTKLSRTNREEANFTDVVGL